MLSLSLRRKSAPGALHVRDGSPAPSVSPSSAKSRSGIPSISSKKSLSSLFTIGSKDESPKYGMSNTDQAAANDRRASKASDELGLVDRAGQPGYSGQKDTQLRTSPSRLFRRQSRSSSAISKASNGQKTFLDSIASKLRAATELFHKTSERSIADSELPSTSQSPRRLSPKKSVRFRSGSNLCDDTRSSPINVPTKAYFSLPQLDLSRSTFDDTLGTVGSDPIPTGRPPSTPVFDLKHQDGYFPPTAQLQPIVEFKAAIEGKQNQTHAMKSAEDANTVFDPGCVTGYTSGDSQKMGLNSHSTSIDSSEVQTANKLEGHKTEPASNQKTVPIQRKHLEEKAPGKHESGEGLSYDQSPIRLTELQAGRQASSWQAPFAMVEASTTPILTGTQPQTFQSGGAEVSAWTLESRVAGEDDSSDSEDVPYCQSSSITPRRQQRERPTHEDIRRQFRTPREKKLASPVELPSAVGNRLENGNTPQTEKQSTGPAPNTPIVNPVQDASVPSVRKDDVQQSLPTDPLKPLPQITTTQPPVELEAVVPDSAVSPLNLKANVSSIAPSRTRSPFKFSDSTDKNNSVTLIGNTSFSWHAKKTGDTGSPSNNPFESQTPSPVSVPLPLSIAPKKFRLTQRSRYTDQHGWSPFNEGQFPEVMVDSTKLHHILTSEGGFAIFWSEVRLPEATAPEPDTKFLWPSEIKKLVKDAVNARSDEETDAKFLGPRSMDKLFSPLMASNINKFAPLASSQRNYSGEVSTAEASTADACSDSGPPCSDTGCNMCLTRASYESSTERSTGGYESDSSSCKENQSLHTPSRVPRPVAGDRTPTQINFMKKQVQPLAISNRKYVRGSEASDGTTTSAGFVSEDEKFARGIV